MQFVALCTLAPRALAPAALTLPQPLYGIDRPTVDAQFEVEAVGARRGRPHGPDGLAVLHAGAFLDGNLQQIAVQGERLRSVVEDHQISESGKSARKCDDAVVDGHGLGAFG